MGTCWDCYRYDGMIGRRFVCTCRVFVSIRPVEILTSLRFYCFSTCWPGNQASVVLLRDVSDVQENIGNVEGNIGDVGGNPVV